MGSHVLRTKNIHCALRIGAFPFSERIRRARIVLRVFLSRFTVRMRRVYRALFGSHALRTKNIHCVLCFGAFTILERETYILIVAHLASPALVLRRALYMYSGAIGLSRFENEEYSLCFAIRGIHVFRAKNMHCL